MHEEAAITPVAAAEVIGAVLPQEIACVAAVCRPEITISLTGARLVANRIRLHAREESKNSGRDLFRDKSH